MQTIKNKITKILSVAVFACCILAFSMPAEVSAQTKPAGCKTISRTACCNKPNTDAKVKYCTETNRIVKTVKTIVNFLAGGIGIVIAGSVIYAGVQYGTAGGSAEAVGAAKKRIRDALIALLAFIFLYAFLQWMIPGGTIF